MPRLALQVLLAACAAAPSAAQTRAWLSGDAGTCGTADTCTVPTHLTCCKSGRGSAGSTCGFNSGGIRLPPINLANTGASALLVNVGGNWYPTADAEGLCAVLTEMTAVQGSACLNANYGSSASENVVYNGDPIYIDTTVGNTPVSDWTGKLSITALSGMTGVNGCVVSASARRANSALCNAAQGTELGHTAPEVYNIALTGVCLDGSLPGAEAEASLLWMTKMASLRIVDPQQIDELPNIAWAKLLNIREFEVSNSVATPCAADGTSKLMHDGVPETVDIDAALDQIQSMSHYDGLSLKLSLRNLCLDGHLMDSGLDSFFAHLAKLDLAGNAITGTLDLGQRNDWPLLEEVDLSGACTWHPPPP
eukprot:SAG22_NODE_1726_length_3712_cov_4.345143_3_plen_364_part_01